MNGKKVCGILTEMSAQMDYVNHIVIGIGINVHNESFPEEIAPVATSLYMETGEHFNRAALIEEVWEQFEHYYAIFMETEDLSGPGRAEDLYLQEKSLCAVSTDMCKGYCANSVCGNGLERNV